MVFWSKREIEVLELKKQGFTQLEIAERLKISQPAVSVFYNKALKKYNESKETIELSKKMRLDKILEK